MLLIDHSLALSPAAWIGAEAPFLPVDSTVRSHCAYASLEGKSRQFARLFGLWQTTIDATALGAVRATIPPSWDEPPGSVDEMIAFLRGRPGVLAFVSATLRRIVR